MLISMIFSRSNNNINIFIYLSSNKNIKQIEAEDSSRLDFRVPKFKRNKLFQHNSIRFKIKSKYIILCKKPITCKKIYRYIIILFCYQKKTFWFYEVLLSDGHKIFRFFVPFKDASQQYSETNLFLSCDTRTPHFFFFVRSKLLSRLLFSKKKILTYTNWTSSTGIIKTYNAVHYINNP